MSGWQFTGAVSAPGAYRRGGPLLRYAKEPALCAACPTCLCFP